MPRRRKLPPDTRLDWRDKDMPVLAPLITMDNKIVIRPVASEEIHKYYERKMANPNYVAPHYKDDPSYWWSRKK